jgi:PAS domain-containing protein
VIAERLNHVKNPPINQDRLLGSGRWINTDIRAADDGLRICTYTDITELKNKESSFRLLFESNPVPMWVHDKASFRFLAANDALIDLLGYSREVLLGMTLFQVVVEEQHGDPAAISGSEGRVDAGLRGC